MKSGASSAQSGKDEEIGWLLQRFSFPSRGLSACLPACLPPSLPAITPSHHPTPTPAMEKNARTLALLFALLCLRPTFPEAGTILLLRRPMLSITAPTRKLPRLLLLLHLLSLPLSHLTSSRRCRGATPHRTATPLLLLSVWPPPEAFEYEEEERSLPRSLARLATGSGRRTAAGCVRREDAGSEVSWISAAIHFCRR